MVAVPTLNELTGSVVNTHIATETVIAAQRDFLAGVLGTTGTIATALAALGVPFTQFITKSAADTVVWRDRGALISASGTCALSLTAAGSLVTFRNSTLQFTVGDGAGLGGFFWIGGCGISDAAAVSGPRMFYGMMTSGSVATNVEPSTLTGCIGIGHGAADTNMKLYFGGSAAQAPIDLGANSPANTQNTDWYELALFAPAGVANTVHWQVTRVNTGHVASGTITGGAAVRPS